MRSVTFTIIGILALGWGLASLAPPHWLFGELFLLAACIVVVRDYLLAQGRGLRMRGTANSMLAGNSAWFTDSAPDDVDAYSQAFHPWDFEQAAAKTRKASAAALLPAAHVVDSHKVYSRKQSVEQIAHDMLMQAFRQASRTHHPDHGGDPENMRRVYAARDMLLRAIHKP
jgi:hypothetical protein